MPEHRFTERYLIVRSPPRIRVIMCLMLLLAATFTLEAVRGQDRSSWKPCAFIHEFQESAGVGEIRITVTCSDSLASGDTFFLPVREPLLIGLTATSSEELSDEAPGDIDFPVQNFVISDNGDHSFVFRGRDSFFYGKKHVIVGFWPQAFFRSCSDGRFGCRHFGYALAAPIEPMTFCKGTQPKTEDDEEEAANKYAVCDRGQQTLVQFR